ncbi:OmpA family protein [Buchnera aphidicola]|uniref:OmpA family protein n=1 Tax=Buchnera aphidicola TaxID=9 RepID=UPI003BEF409A
MKKKATAIAFLLASLVTSVQANAENRWYMGTKMGWSHLNLMKHEKSSKQSDHNLINKKESAPIVGLFLGYNLNSHIGFEIANDTTGFHPYLMFNKKDKSSQFNNIQLSTKLSYPMTKSINVYTQVGGLLFWEDMSSKEDLKHIFTKHTSVIPSVSLGAEYIINKTFITRLDYTWKNSFKNIIHTPIKSKSGDLSFSFGWKFGNPHIHDIVSLYSSEISEKPYVTLNESINFPFDSTEIQQNNCEKLYKLDAKIKKMKLKNISIVLSGYSDRIGDDHYNQMLSEERAYNVKDYFISRGLPNSAITVQGLGNSYPMTNQACKNVDNHDLLVNCLAPDRRVDIEIIAE